MTRILLCSAFLVFGVIGANAQSFEIRPDAGYIKGANPDLDLTGSDEPQIRGIRSRGTLTSPNALSLGSGLLDLTALGHNGTSFTGDRVGVRFTAAENWTESANGTDIRFSTTSNGTISPEERMRLTHKGYLGLNIDDPAVPLHINYFTTGINSTSGTAIFGQLSLAHTNISGSSINAWNSTNGTTLFLNSSAGAKVQIGGTSGATQSDLDVNGFSKLGSSAPKIKMKEISGTTSSLEGGLTNVSHGISNAEKILAIDITVNAAAPSANDFVPPSYTYHLGHEFNYHYDDGAISVRNIPGNSANILSKPIKILVTYKE
ncbi:hypothetical protein [uncultured Arcticibacterium sp.]|uniref:hypothetical protein n=1 Tax=uncultured Arcticibacterium sp. TaxID=2173042 RepID=UPI0030F8F54E